MKSLPLALSLSLLAAVSVTVASAKTPHFLFLGQSNMEGIVAGTDFGKTMDILLESSSCNNDTITIYDRLVLHLQSSASFPATPKRVYNFLASELMRLKNESWIHPNFTQPLSTVDCSFYSLNKSIDYRIPGIEPGVFAVDVDLSAYSRCGKIFGPELMFGHVMQDDVRYIDQLFSIVKFVAGGSNIHRNWSREVGYMWEKLVERIRDLETTTEEWTAIVWYQGENDALFNETADGYLGNLTQFIQDVREEVYNIDNTTFESPTEIPVVIVGMSCWIYTLHPPLYAGPTLIQAQLDYVAASADDNVRFVPTNDLSCHFHLDDVSQLIIGERVALALKELLPYKSRMPSALPSVAPSTASPSGSIHPSMEPSKQPSASLLPTLQPSDVPSAVPSVTPSMVSSDLPSTSEPSITESQQPSVYPSSVPTKLPTTDVPSMVESSVAPSSSPAGQSVAPMVSSSSNAPSSPAPVSPPFAVAPFAVASQPTTTPNQSPISPVSSTLSNAPSSTAPVLPPFAVAPAVASQPTTTTTITPNQSSFAPMSPSDMTTTITLFPSSLAALTHMPIFSNKMGTMKSVVVGNGLLRAARIGQDDDDNV